MPSSKTHIFLAFGILLIPTIAIVDTILAFSRGWNPISRLDELIIFFIVVFILATIALFTLSKYKKFTIKNPTKILLAIITFFICTLVCELTLRPFSGTRIHRQYGNLHEVYKPAAGLMPGVNGESTITTNSLGLRGPELPLDRKTYRILAIGGSTTQCIYLDDTETWPNLLMEKLTEKTPHSIWVGNAGVSGYSSPHHLTFMRESSLMNKIDCLVVLVGVNDLLSYKRSGTTNIASLTANLSPLWSRSAILQMVRGVWHAYFQKNDIRIEDSAGENYRLRRSMRHHADKTSQLPPISSSLKEYRARIESMHNVCQSRNVRLIFLTQPVLWGEDNTDSIEKLLWMGTLPNGEYLTSGALRKGMNLFNNTLISTCKEIGIDYIDLQSMSGNELFFYDDCHFNERGAEEVAAIVSKSFPLK